MTNLEMNKYHEPELMKLKQIELDSKLMENAAKDLGYKVDRLTNHTFVFSDPVTELSAGVWWTRESPFDPDAKEVCKNKGLTKGVLNTNSVRVPEGFTIDVNELDLNEVFEVFEGPVTVKPNVGTGGLGVHVNVQTLEDFIEAVIHIKDDEKIASRNDGNVLVEQYLKGTEVRLIVVDDEVVSVWMKQPPHVVGDGEHTVQELTEPWNAARATNPRLWRRPMKVNEEYLAPSGLTAESVPAPGQRVELHPVGSLARGSATWDITDSTSNTVKAEAVKAVQAVPGLTVAGVDMIVRSGFGRDANSVLGVLELNSAPSISSVHFPVFGSPRLVAYDMIKHYARKNGLNV